MGSVDLLDNRDLHLQVKEIIVKHIRKGNYKQDSRLPSYREFAQIANVSPPTVQHAVASLIDEGVLYSRRGRGTFIRMIPGTSNFKKKKIGIYACIVPGLHYNTVAARVYEIEKCVFKNIKRHMLIMNSDGDLELEISFLDSVLDRNVDALIFQPAPQVYTRPVFARAINLRLQKFIAAGIPVILLDRVPGSGFDTIVPNEKESCELALKHLTELGHRRILFVVDPGFYQPKIRAFKEVCKEFSLTEKQMRFIFLEEGDPITETIKTLNRVYDECCPFTAMIAAADHYALGCYSFLKSKGIKCPDDVSIVGFDNLEFIEKVDFQLTTVWCEPSEVAKAVYKQLEYRMQNGYSRKEASNMEIEISPKLILRKSTRRPSLKSDHI